MRTFFVFFVLCTSLLARNVIGFIENANTNEFVANAKVCDSKKCVLSDASGTFIITTDEERLHVKAYGFRPYGFDVNASKIHFIRPVEVKALYLTFWGANPRSKTFKRTLQLLQSTPVNSIIVDVKNEYGDLLYKSGLQKAAQNRAYENRQVYDIQDFVGRLKQHDAYLIARIVVFKDQLQASHNREYAIKDANGELWRNHDNIAWVDPFDRRSWEYTLDIAEDAAKQGFDEINFDYIRFPARRGLQLSRPSTLQSRTQAIAEFLQYAQKRLQKYGVFISVDTFGNICWSDDDTNIGQTVELFAKNADYLCPMVYPSSFASGTLGYTFPSEYPYEMVFRSIDNIKERIDLTRVRPWVQAFSDYTVRKKSYGPKEVQEQIRAATQLGANGWMLWSPSSKYKTAYFQSSDAREFIASFKDNAPQVGETPLND